MSINSLTNVAMARRVDTAPLAEVPQGLDGVTKAAATLPVGPMPPVGPLPPPPTGPMNTPPASANPASQAPAVNTALNVLFGFIPTEILTLYVAVLAVLPGADSPAQLEPGQVTTFLAFLVATPIVTWLVYALKARAIMKPTPWRYKDLPLWEMSASTIAYTVWALTLPGRLFVPEYTSGLAGIGVLVVSTGLGLISPFFQRPLSQS